MWDLKGKKVIHWGGPGGMGELSKLLLGSVILVFTTLLCLLLVLYVLVSSIHYFFYLTTALLKSDVFRHSNSLSSHSFQPTGIELGSLWRGNRCVLPIIAVYLYFFFFYKFLKLLILLKKNMHFSKNSIKFIIHFFSKNYNWAYVYMY